MKSRYDGRNDEGEVRFPSRWRRTRTWSCRLRADLREVERPQSGSGSCNLSASAPKLKSMLDDALAELEEIRIDAKKALAAAASH